MRRIRIAAFVACVAGLLGGMATGQTNIGGTIADGSGGPLLSGQVYVVTQSLTVAANTTLTVQPGAIVKFSTSQQFRVDGTLIANGAAQSRIVFTSIADDSAGGDTNNNGPSAGAAGDWVAMRFNAASDASVLRHVDIRYAGRSSATTNATLEIFGSDLTVDRCVIRDGLTSGVDFNRQASAATVTGCQIDRHALRAVVLPLIDTVRGLSNNTATGNGGNYIWVAGGSVTTSMSLAPANCLGGALVLNGSIVIPTGVALTLAAGTVVKGDVIGRFLRVEGTLAANGTATNPVVLTSITDDSIAGDTNGDGPSVGAAGQWDGVIFTATASGSALRFTEIRFGGRFGATSNASVEILGSNVTLDNCVIRDGRENGIDFNRTASSASVTNCRIDNHGKVAITDPLIQSVPNLQNNTASGNGANYTEVAASAATSDLTITAANCLGGALVLRGFITIPVGVTLTLDAGVVMKSGTLSPVSLVVAGRLMANGTAPNPVVLTSLPDDSVAGDTNGDGPSAGAPGQWDGIRFDSTADGSALRWTEVRYAARFGAFSNASVEINGADITMDRCTIRDGKENGIDFNGVVSNVAITESAIERHGKVAVEGGPIEAVPGFVNVTATGNAQNFYRVTKGVTNSSLTIGAQNVVGSAIVVATPVSFQDGAKLTILPGVTFKMLPATYFRVINAANLKLVQADLLGTAAEPIVFTAFADDTIGGDTNGDGPSTGARGAWNGLTVSWGGPALPSRAEHVLVRYCGGPGTEGGKGVELRGAVARAVRVEHSAGHGIIGATLNGPHRNLVAFDCFGSGVIGTNVHHATVASCNTGFEGSSATCVPPGAPQLVNCIAAFCGTNYRDFNSWQVQNSFGVPPTNGPWGGCWPNTGPNNIVGTDPRFVNRTTGDLRLAASSPCLNAGDVPVATATVKDFDEHSRLLDHDLSGAMLPDMGAHERAAWTMGVLGQPKLGTTITAAVFGPSGSSIYAIGALDLQALIAPYGYLTVGNPATMFISGSVPVATPFQVAVPAAPAIVGFTIGMQTLTTPTGNPARGNITNLYRATFRP